MYDFKHQINDNKRFNTYEIYTTDSTTDVRIYQKVRNSLFFIVLIVGIFFTGAFSLKGYQYYSLKQTSSVVQEIHITDAPILKSVYNTSAQMALRQAITKSVIHNLKSNKSMKHLNYTQLKVLIKKIVKKIQHTPLNTKYTQK